MSRAARGAVPSPNIWSSPGVYELENRAVDRSGAIEQAMRRIRPWSGQTFLDLGCGTGFHLSRWATEATQVIGVEPHPQLAAAAGRRCRHLAHVVVRTGAAQDIPLPDTCVDVAHARWAYFFGPGCEPGLAELDRVVRRGGAAFVIDNDATRSTFGRWFRNGYPDIDPVAVERFWSAHGWARTPLQVEWQFDSRADFEAVVRIEFPAEHADRIIAEHEGLSVDYAVNLWSRTY